MKTTEENNRIIAEFMEFHEIMLDEESRYDMSDIYDILEIDIVAIGTVDVSDLEFHNSWDWLMPVVEKIERLEFTIEKNFQRIDGDYQCLITKGNDILFQEFNESSITAMHYVVVQFIEYYNKQK